MRAYPLKIKVNSCKIIKNAKIKEDKQ